MKKSGSDDQVRSLRTVIGSCDESRCFKVGGKKLEFEEENNGWSH